MQHQAQQSGYATGSQNEALQKAQSGNKIMNSSTEDIKSVLKKIFLLLGLNDSDIPDDEEKEVMIEFLFDQWGQRYTMMEILLAVKWGISGFTDVDSSLYKKRFSPAFLSRFMQPYDMKKRQLNKLAKPAPVQPPVEKEEYSDEHYLRHMECRTKSLLEIPKDIDYVACYKQMKREGKDKLFCLTVLYEKAFEIYMKEEAKSATRRKGYTLSAYTYTHDEFIKFFTSDKHKDRHFVETFLMYAVVNSYLESLLENKKQHASVNYINSNI